MAPLLLYATCAVAAIGLYMILRPGSRALHVAGSLVGVAALAYLASELIVRAGGWGESGAGDGFWPVYALFCLIALGGAVRMVTHPRPVYAALYFVLVVIASAALFLLLQAEFMAFALVIVYAGAILITYLFVLMLAQQAESENELETLAEYDRVPREPATAVVVGLLMVAVLAHALFAGSPAVDGRTGRPGPSSLRGQAWPAGSAVEADNRAWRDLDLMPKARDAALRELAPGLREVVVRDGRAISVRDGKAFATIVDADGASREVEFPASAKPINSARVGLALVAKFPVSLELAGVILTMAMFGAVVLARRQAELGEDQRRQAVGMRRLTVDDGEPVERDAGLRGPRGGAR
ncbi:MAG: NADH-quinone oxidoreductase subunit J [Phycisphaerales bacterium]